MKLYMDVIAWLLTLRAWIYNYIRGYKVSRVISEVVIVIASREGKETHRLLNASTEQSV